jgi:YfiH family protein
MINFLTPNWPAPKNIQAYTTLRPHDLRAQPTLLKNIVPIPNEPIWIKQIHSNIALPASPQSADQTADAVYTDQFNQVCAILTADCLPILLCHRQGTHVAAIHAGWRGLANGIIENTLHALNLSNADLLAWLGPAIGPNHFEVGDEVRALFIEKDAEAATCFKPSPSQRWMADLYALARLRLKKQHVTAIYGGEHCTYSEQEHFFSYRRDGQDTGRMASVIWIS